MSLPLQAFLRALAVARFTSAYASPPSSTAWRPLYPPLSFRSRTSFNPDPLPTAFHGHTLVPLRGNLIFRDDGATSTTPSASSSFLFPRDILLFPAHEMFGISRPKARLWINFDRGYEVFFFFLLIFSFFLSLPPLWKGFLWKRECRVCWVWIVVPVVMNIWSVFFLWFGFWIDWADWWFSRWVEKCWWIVVKIFFFFL